MVSQRHLNMPVSERTTLAGVDVVRASLGVDADTVYGMVDAGELRWVWNVSSGGGEVREFRFWMKEIVEPKSVDKLSAFSVINLILGSARQRWSGSEIERMLLVSRPQVKRLRESGELPGEIVGGKLSVSREALKTFLRQRLVANAELIQ